MNKPPSLIKWSGSKRSQAETISALFPDDANVTYWEPFLGGGSVLYYGAQYFRRAEASDLYQPLIEVWTSVKNNPQNVKDSYRSDWDALQSAFPDYFYTVRNRFNSEKKGQDLLFLSRTCVNGIIRFNSKGEFNNAIHLTRRGMQPQLFSAIVDRWASVLGNVRFSVADYEEILGRVKAGDFVYLDPPYANSHNRYVEDLDIGRFMRFLDSLNRSDVKWALSFDGVRGSDDFTYSVPEDLYRRRIKIETGHSHVQQVLNGTKQTVIESLYVNYDPCPRRLNQLKFNL